MIFRIAVAPLSKRSVIIVAGRLGTESSAGIGTVHIPEICSAVEHIHTDRYAMSQHPIQLFGRTLVGNRRMTFPPFIKPSRIELRHKVRTARMIFIHDFKYILAEHTVQSRQCTGNMSGFHLPTAVASKQRNIESGFLKHITDSSKVFFVGRIRTVFVFHLYHDNITAVVDSQGGQLLAKFLDISFAIRHETRVLTTISQVLFFQEPRRITSEIPFRTHVWPGTKNDIQPFFLCNTYKLGNIRLSAEIKYSGLPFVEVPEYISRHGVQPHCMRSVQTVTPILVRNTGIMHFSAYQLHIFPVNIKSTIFYFNLFPGGGTG